MLDELMIRIINDKIQYNLKCSEMDYIMHREDKIKLKKLCNKIR